MNTVAEPVESRDLATLAEGLAGMFREARMGVKYYGAQLAWYQKANLLLEIGIALGTSTALLSLPLLSAGSGKWISGVLIFFATVASIVKPLLGWTTKIEGLSKLYAGYNAAFVTAQRLVRESRLNRGITDEMERELRDLHEQMLALCAKDDPCPDGEAIKKFEDEVNQEFPISEFWWPAKSPARKTEQPLATATV
jgi:hypothetical protein